MFCVTVKKLIVILKIINVQTKVQLYVILSEKINILRYLKLHMYLSRTEMMSVICLNKKVGFSERLGKYQ